MTGTGTEGGDDQHVTPTTTIATVADAAGEAPRSGRLMLEPASSATWTLACGACGAIHRHRARAWASDGIDAPGAQRVHAILQSGGVPLREVLARLGEVLQEPCPVCVRRGAPASCARLQQAEAVGAGRRVVIERVGADAVSLQILTHPLVIWTPQRRWLIAALVLSVAVGGFGVLGTGSGLALAWGRLPAAAGTPLLIVAAAILVGLAGGSSLVVSALHALPAIAGRWWVFQVRLLAAGVLMLPLLLLTRPHLAHLVFCALALGLTLGSVAGVLFAVRRLPLTSHAWATTALIAIGGLLAIVSLVLAAGFGLTPGR